jgi:hypothetical protein
MAAKRLPPFLGFCILPHRDPDVGVDDLCAFDGFARVDDLPNAVGGSAGRSLRGWRC